MLRCYRQGSAACKLTTSNRTISRGLLSLVGMIILLSLTPLCWSRKPLAPQDFAWTRADITIIARGFGAISSTGNMDTYLALISAAGRNDPTTAARIVDYYASFEPGIDYEIASGRTLRLRLSYAAYCKMTVRAFAVQDVIDPEALSRLRGADNETPMPCFIVRR